MSEPAAAVAIAIVGAGLSITHTNSTETTAASQITDQQAGTTGSSTTGSNTGGAAAPAEKVVHPTTRLGDLTTFATITTDVQGSGHHTQPIRRRLRHRGSRLREPHASAAARCISYDLRRDHGQLESGRMYGLGRRHAATIRDRLVVTATSPIP